MGYLHRSQPRGGSHLKGADVSHANEDLIRRLFETYRRGDRGAAAEFFAEDAVFRYPGPGPLHGDHRGRDGIVDLWAEQDRLSGGAFMPELVDLGGGGGAPGPNGSHPPAAPSSPTGRAGRVLRSSWCTE